MSPVSLLLNIIWIVLGGAWMAFGWLVAAVVMAITIIGIPWARAAFNIAAGGAATMVTIKQKVRRMHCWDRSARDSM